MNNKVLVSVGRRFLFRNRDYYLNQKDKEQLSLPDGVILKRPAGVEIEFIQLRKQIDVGEPYSFHDARALIYSLPIDDQVEMQKIVHLGHWKKRHQHCGICGSETANSEKEIARVCTNCGETYYPRISPSVIGAVIKEDKILMGRSAHFPDGMISVLAGFVEPGESAEEALAREVMEESSIEIDSIKYVASQPWPFPDSLMLGYFAKYKSGEIKIDPNELEFAKWYSVKDLEKEIIPGEFSIARTLINRFIEEYSR